VQAVDFSVVGEPVSEVVVGVVVKVTNVLPTVGVIIIAQIHAGDNALYGRAPALVESDAAPVESFFFLLG